MAIARNNIVTEGLRGMLGNTIVFRNLRGKTVVSNRPSLPRRQSALQRKNRNRFREATFFARASMCDPQKKQYYQIKAHKLGLPNAYTAAITDFMRKPRIDAVKFKGQRVVIKADKKGFALASVEVTVSPKGVLGTDAKGLTYDTHNATLLHGRRNEWVVHIPGCLLANIRGQRITIIAKDHVRNMDILTTERMR